MRFAPRRHRAPVLLFAAALLLPAAPVGAAEPSLGDAVTLPDGRVLPPMLTTPGVGPCQLTSRLGGVPR